jgi:hypothetical protein
MKKTIILATLFLISNISFATCLEDSREATIVNGKKLTPFWGQEYIGSDLIRKEIESTNMDLPKVKVALFDTGFERDHINVAEEVVVVPKKNGRRKMTAHHGTSIANLINGSGQHRVTDLSEYVGLYATGSYYFAYPFLKFEKNENFPKIISNSTAWKDEGTVDIAKKAYDKNILWFLAAGNKHPQKVSSMEANSMALLVGSMAPSGLQSLGSQADSRALILAPGNSELATINGKGEEVLFGGTSGATPMVAGTMVNIAAVLPSITREQTFTLLQKTSFLSAENTLGDLTQPGLLNSYKAFKVALRVKSICHNDNDCITNELNKDSTYKFSKEKLITCDDYKRLSCNGRLSVLEKMRKNALLGNKEQDLVLSCAYLTEGFQKNAEFYKFRAKSKLDIESMRQETIKSLKAGIFKIAYYRYLPILGEDVKNILINESSLPKHRISELLELYSL